MRATAYVAAAHQYQLFIDGKKVAAGPSFSYPDESYYEATDVTDALRGRRRQRDRRAALLVRTGPGPPGLARRACSCRSTSCTRTATTRSSGPTAPGSEHPAEWLPAAPRNDEGGFTERVDGRLQPQGWALPGFDAKGWTHVAVIGPVGTKPFTHLVAQRTHIVEQPVKPVARSARWPPAQ